MTFSCGNDHVYIKISKLKLTKIPAFHRYTGLIHAARDGTPKLKA
jgi:hypothetical protein